MPFWHSSLSQSGAEQWVRAEVIETLPFEEAERPNVSVCATHRNVHVVAFPQLL